VEVLATSEMASGTTSDEDDDSWASANFSRLDDLGALCCFVSICDYLLDGGDFDYGGYKLMWP
jgi:hypothetical protein